MNPAELRKIHDAHSKSIQVIEQRYIKAQTNILKSVSPIQSKENRDEIVAKLYSMLDLTARQLSAVDRTMMFEMFRRAGILYDHQAAERLKPETIIEIRRRYRLVHPEKGFTQMFWRDISNLKKHERLSTEDAIREVRYRLLRDATRYATRELDLVKRATRDTSLSALGFSKFQRVLSPGACQFCVLISTRVFSTGDLQPLHDRCRCTVMPLRNNTINAELNSLANAVKPVATAVVSIEPDDSYGNILKFSS